MTRITGLHHVTAIAGDAHENLQFYREVLGMRLVKRSVNQDSPGTYHLFYADAAGHPGADLTFFPWPEMDPARIGAGLTTEVSLAVPTGTLDKWVDRFESCEVEHSGIGSRRGEKVLPFSDPHGLPLVLAETSDEREFTAWKASPVNPAMQIRGLHSVRLWESQLGITREFLTKVLEFEESGEDDGWHRYEIDGGGSGKFLEIRETPDAHRGKWGTGGVHHIAWRVPDEATQLAMRARIERAHRRPTEVIDRFWFKSVYFLEPGGVLFELATDGPGFTADEDMSALGEKLVLPPWLEPYRQRIEASLPRL